MYQSVNEACIADMVATFYAQVRNDQLLRPIFEDAIGSHWETHLLKMNAFWSSVLLASATYKANPMLAHLQLRRLTQHHFGRWLELWRDTAGRLCSEAVAILFIQKAEMIGERLLYAISAYHDAATRQQ
jgi:hemoglobin